MDLTPIRNGLRRATATMPCGAVVGLVLFGLFGLPPAPANAAQTSTADVQSEEVVGIRVVPPFVIDVGDGVYTGLTVDLWDHLARQLGIEYRFEERDIDGLLDGLENGELFASASALTITSDREARVDFTHPFLVTGLGIAVADRGSDLGQALLGFLSRDFLWVVLLLGLLLLFWGTLVWAFERRQNEEQFGGSPAKGIGSGFWWAAVTMTTVGYGDKAPKTVGGRAVGFAWMFVAIIVISFVTAAIASSLTLDRLDGRVQGPQDLPSVRVGALDGAASVAYLADEGVGAAGYPTIAEGLEAVANNEIDAFVHDAPILRYTTQESFPGQVRVLPDVFQEQFYGIALPLDSEHRKAVNQALLDYVAGDVWGRHLRRYLGSDD